ncbi:RNA dependent RNA polymerase [Plasmopara viticola lesion associated ourmia-like virus 22]|uniref:RNA dependent RNA polymerase n=1 Tax=Plasmopara viticola lesion associated ourmia-like virus 22 TaxID=2686490 RepID=A0ABX6FJ06_9VIRU|nr:RNA dependent RNA polymerase [Plasmopara viticola lesion associated ourmia-like virus 22]QGY72552.1 RNA dependent RNA polymerase [Plasmopara viticola lesion associated ourmia-like virus 22]
MPDALSSSMVFVPESSSKAKPTRPDGLSDHLKDLEFLRSRIESVYDVLLPVVLFDDLSSLKQFCSGLLLPSSDHPWSRPIRRLVRRDRLSIAGSLFLFRKTLPASRPSLSSYVSKMTEPAPAPAPGYMEFISREINKMFPIGWDRGYRGAVHGTCVRPSSCLENKSKHGGARMLALEHFESRADFIESCLAKYGGRTPAVSLSKAVIAPCAGKDRIVTVNSIDMTMLTPYHTVLYDFLSTKKWCLRGEARTRCFSEFVSVDGEVLVSGDYESATDNLNQDVALHIMGLINRRCSSVPLHIRDGASRTLSPTISVDGEYHKVHRGQLMGNAMSFPLLCLQNYLAFKFLIPRAVPVKINGDDIVFRSTLAEYEKWKNGVQACGLTLSEGKTMVDKRNFSLNSTFFVAGSKRIREAPVIRSTALLGKFNGEDGFSSLTGRLNTLRPFGPSRRYKLVTSFLGRNRAVVRASQRSLTRGLGLGWLSKREIIGANLAEHESFYLSLDSKYDPAPDGVPGYFRSSVPQGWRRVRKDTPVDISVQKEFSRELVEHTWQPERFEGNKRVVWTARFSSPYKSKFARKLYSARQLLRRITGFLIPKKECGVMRWERCEVERQLEEEFIDRFDVEKGNGWALRLDDLSFYDFSHPSPSAFPSSFHDLSLCS